MVIGENKGKVENGEM